MVALLLILAAVTTSLVRGLTPWAKQYKGDVEHHLSVLIGQPVTIQTLETGWYWFQPVLKLSHVSVKEHHKTALSAEELFVGINLFKSLWYWHIHPGVFYLEDLHVNVREQGGIWRVDGITPTQQSQTDVTPERIQEMTQWLSQQERFVIKRVSAHVYFENGTLIPISGLNLSIVNAGGQYQFKGDAQLLQTNPTFFQLMGDVRFDSAHPDNTKGHIYFSAKNMMPTQWQKMFFKSMVHVQGGRADVALWVDFNHGAISSVQAKVLLKRLAWNLPSKKNDLIQSFFANIAWTPNDTGWKLAADAMQLRIGGVNWPENKLLVQYDKTQQSTSVYIKSINIESLRAAHIDWPKALNPLLALKPQGMLTDTQCVVKANQLVSLLTRFESLGWQADADIPEVQNLSGALNWKPDAGRLEFDSEKTLIKMKDYLEQKNLILNAAFAWNVADDGIKLNIERFLLNHPELTVNAEGVVDGIKTDNLGQIQLNVGFSGKNLQQWMRFLPKKNIKPKLYQWLLHDVTRIGEATGTVVLKGQAQDFPFDKTPGDFSIIAHVLGTSVFINSKWLPIEDIEAYVRLKKRDLEFDLVNASLQGVPIKQMHLRIDALGNNKETLLIHGIVRASVQKMIDYVLASPLKSKLSTLGQLTFTGLALLNLRLEIPLYPQNDEVLVSGNLTLQDNALALNHVAGDIGVSHLNGSLMFNEHGISNSVLTGVAFDYPITIKAQSQDKPKPHTLVLIDGEYTIDALKKRSSLPIFSLMEGGAPIQAVLQFAGNAEDGMSFKSTLKGVAIHLPPPIGKSLSSEMPLEATIELHAPQTMRLKMHYANRLSADMTFVAQKGAYQLKSGTLGLGAESYKNQMKQGFAVVGQLKGFDLDEWKKALNQLSMGNAKTDILSQLNIVDVKFDKLNFLKQDFNDLILKAKRLAHEGWSLILEHKNVAAILRFHPTTKLLSGHFNRLHLNAYQSQNTNTSSHLKPEDIPNLDIQANNFSVGEIQIGQVALKSQSTPNRWHIKSCHIESPVYRFDVQGEWTRAKEESHSSVQVTLAVTDLAKSLEMWHISPVVGARKGEVEFKGEWSNTPFDFSLAHLKGSMYIKLKNGVITHLSHETEEKLGLGKLLSILSLQTIPRRLTLDFSDLAHEGYSFDTFKGTFIMNHGIMSTNDSTLDGPVAYASMKGDLDLVQRTYALDLNISPHITASLPVVATIAGGPIIGVAAWVANKLINQGMQKISAYSYKISGPWGNPSVEQMSIVKKNIKKR
jgi:uncharacterized protein (TIGR02099 family)